MSSNAPQCNNSLQNNKKTNKFVNLFKTVYHQKHLDFYAPILLLLILLIIIPSSLAIVSGYIDQEKAEDKALLLNYIGTVAITGGLFYTAKGLHDQYHYNKRAKASDYVAFWYDPEFSKSLRVLRDIKKEYFDGNDNLQKEIEKIRESNLEHKPSNNSSCPILEIINSDNKEAKEQLNDIQFIILEEVEKDRDKKDHVNRVLCFFEQLSEDIRLKVADELYLKDFFYVVIINYYQLFKRYIQYKHWKRKNSFAYCNFVYIAKQWEDPSNSPALPETCQYQKCGGEQKKYDKDQKSPEERFQDIFNQYNKNKNKDLTATKSIL